MINNFRYKPFVLIYFVLVSAFSVNSWSFDLQIIDQQGDPVENAVVSIPRGVISEIGDDYAVMDQVDKRFLPKVLAIKKGTQVIFPNSDNIRHHVYSFSKTKPFEMKLYAGTPNAPVTFENEGVVVLGCNIHDAMLGYIVVYGDGRFGVVDDAGKVVFSNPKESVTTLNVWHPHLADKTKTHYSGHLSGEDNISVTINIDHPPKKKPSKKNKFGRFYK